MSNDKINGLLEISRDHLSVTYELEDDPETAKLEAMSLLHEDKSRINRAVG